MHTILILGGYGNFGKRIVESLIHLDNLDILVAGRDCKKAEQLTQQLSASSTATLTPVELDINSFSFETELEELKPNIVIHTSGPFQGQNYRVAEACIKLGCHYIDLADDRRFVCDITTLNEQAKAKKVLLVSGASTVPGLSSVVLDHYSPQFNTISSIDLAIAPGNKAERGEATVNAILSYTGQVFDVFSQGEWRHAYGWMDARKVDFGDIVGQRWLANVDVPDLELFPSRYSVKESVRFQAGLELAIMHLPMVTMAWLAKVHLVKNWAPLTKPIVTLSNFFLKWGTDQGGMRIIIKGLDKNNKAKTITWSLYADNGIGPYTPTLSTIIIAKKLITGDINLAGSVPCLGLFSYDELSAHAETLDIYFKEEIIG